MRKSLALMKFVALVFVCAVWAPEGVVAQEVDEWKFRGDINWNHPDGRVIRGQYANSKVDDDRFSIIRSRTTGRWYVQFLYQDRAQLLDRPSRFFIETSGAKNAGRAYLEIDGRAWPGGGLAPGLVVSQLSSRDLATLWRYAGNLVGVTYVSRAPGEANGRARAYKFSGKQLRTALLQLGYKSSGATTGLGTVPSQRRPVVSRPSVAGLPSRYVPFRVRFTSCTRPPDVRYLPTNQNARARRYSRLTRAYSRCRRNNSQRNKQALIRHVRNDGGTIRLEGRKWRYNGPIDCRCGDAYKAMVRRSIQRINAYVQVSNDRMARYERIIDDRNRRVRRANRRDRLRY